MGEFYGIFLCLFFVIWTFNSSLSKTFEITNITRSGKRGSPTCVFFLDVLSKIFPVGHLIITQKLQSIRTPLCFASSWIRMWLFTFVPHIPHFGICRCLVNELCCDLSCYVFLWSCKHKFYTQTFRPPSSPAPPPDPSAQQAWHQASSLQQHSLEKPQDFPPRFWQEAHFAQISFTFNIFIVFVVNVNVDVNPKHLGCFKHLQRVVSRVA